LVCKTLPSREKGASTIFLFCAVCRRFRPKIVGSLENHCEKFRTRPDRCLAFISSVLRQFAGYEISPPIDVVSKDHFVPKAYLRGFTPEYLIGGRGGAIVVYSSAFGTSRRLSMNDYVACEAEFYDNHPIDNHGSQTIEQKWPSVRDALKDRSVDAGVLDQLFWFVAAQVMRTHSYMNRVARFLALRGAKKIRVNNQGRERIGLFMNMADTTEVLDYVQARWPKARDALETDYTWTIYHNSYSRRFLTSDDPCQWNRKTEEVMIPLALDMALVGRITEDGEEPTFRHSRASADLIAKVNRDIARGCDSFVYAHEETEELRRFVKRNYVQPDIMFGGRSFTNDPEPMSDEKIARLMKRFEKLRKPK
jgi:hypothetical protein